MQTSKKASEIKNNLEKILKKQELKMIKNKEEIENAEIGIKLLIKKGEKEKAKRLLGLKKKRETNLLNLQKKYDYLDTHLTKVEAMEDQAEVYDAITKTNKAISKNKQNLHDIQEQMEKAKENEEQADFVNEQVSEMFKENEAMDDDDSLEEMFKDYEDEVNQNMQNNFEEVDKQILSGVEQKNNKKNEKKDFNKVLTDILI